jgi:uncharacterized radical SAM protein YgiQ
LIQPLPTTCDEARRRGWDALDIILVSGDAYIDHPAFGVPLLGRWLEAHGFRVGIIPQPDWRSKEPFMALGRPRLVFGVSAGAMDSMVAHYTPQKRLRHDDAYTPGNRHGGRPNRASIIYTSRLKEVYKDVPVVLGGIEASLRRLAHYDFWEDKLRRSILLDAKADLLIYGMGERSLLELAKRLHSGESFRDISDLRGSCLVGRHSAEGAVVLPSWEQLATDKAVFADAHRLMEQEQNPYCGQRLVQSYGDRQVVCNPPALPLSPKELDTLYALPFTREPHPCYKEQIPAFEQIKRSITTHRGCFGGCSFCAITMHQGKFIQSRSHASVQQEVGRLAAKGWFKGQISDLGGPTANMYGLVCKAPDSGHGCRRPSCLHPAICPNLQCSDAPAAGLLRKVRGIPGVRQVVISSGIRYDLLERQPDYFKELVAHHVGGLLKVAPEHLAHKVTTLMRKPDAAVFERFLVRFRGESTKLGKRQGVVPYLMAGHPGCTVDTMVELALALRRLRLQVEQVQEFTPTPGTAATCMYYTGVDPISGKLVYVPRGDRERRIQKGLLLLHLPEEQARVSKGLQEMGRSDLLERLDLLRSPGVAEKQQFSRRQKKRTPR